MNETARSGGRGGGRRLELDFGDSDRDDSMVELNRHEHDLSRQCPGRDIGGECQWGTGGDGSCGERAAE